MFAVIFRKAVKMKRILLFAVALVATMTAGAQVRPFVQGGLGTSEFWLMNAEGTKARFAYLGGLGVDCPIKNTQWGIRVAVMMSTKGADAPPTADDNTDMTIQMNYLELPLDVTYRAAINNDWSVKLAGGPYFAYGIGGDTEVKTNLGRTVVGSFSGPSPMRRFDAGLNAQMMFEYKKLFFGVNWDLGFVPTHEKERALDNKTFPSNSSSAIIVGFYLR